MKFYGAALREEGDQVRAILLMELCKGNLMKHIFLNPKNIPGLPSSTPPTVINTIRWAEEIAIGLEFIHSRGIVHRDFKLENILVRCVIKVVSFLVRLANFSLILSVSEFVGRDDELVRTV